ncbi:NADH pyrophosphatase [Thalassovita autumnalis]|uniref:NAD(+) diphosphatase n=1 Tax=Thalassovita autumnalis TaxID=2072972 RepID=A0A0P1FYK0_9RHOB|nr:NAD(+) diphosphatase [Thalassovita autumnalis]CUH68602.1 NADH pyrophosphatase [Thalassovita autumnalis]CUH74126.1 NADH pyrophosphatase [Thalassovita autumnalis]
MKNAESVTFGGSGLNRAAELRADVTDLLADPRGTVVVLWRGKPLIAEPDTLAQLVRLPLDHPVLALAKGAPIFLGIEDTGPVFAQDISAWHPEALDDATLNAFTDPSRQQHPLLPEAQFVELRMVMNALSPRDAELVATARALFNWHRSHRFCAQCGQPSDMAMAGWQRNCGKCGASHFPRTDPVVIMLITRGNQVLMGRSPGWPEGMYSLLAGFVEPGETIEAAVRREVWEEAGITVGAVDYLASQPWAFPNSLMFGCAGQALSDEITIDPNEIEDARWFSREEIMQAFAGRHPVLKPARKGAIAHFLLRNWLADRME